MGNPRRLYVADKSKPEIRQRQPQTNTRKCGTQPAHKSMPAVVKMPCLLLCSTASRMRAFVLKAGKERVMIKELANEHKRASTVFEPPQVSGPPEVRVFRLHSGRRAGCASGIHQRDRHLIADRAMRPFLVVQHDDRTPTGQRFASFCIRGIPGLVSSSTSMRRWPKGRLFSVAAFLALLLIGSLKSRRGCSTDP